MGMLPVGRSVMITPSLIMLHSVYVLPFLLLSLTIASHGHSNDGNEVQIGMGEADPWRLQGRNTRYLEHMAKNHGYQHRSVKISRRRQQLRPPTPLAARGRIWFRPISPPPPPPPPPPPHPPPPPS